MFKIKNEKLCVWLDEHRCQQNCIFSAEHPLIQKFFTSLSSIKDMELPDIGGDLAAMFPAKSAPDSPGNAEKTDLSELNYLPCLIFPKQDLRIRKYNRLVRDTRGLGDDQILAKCAQYFQIREIDAGKGISGVTPRKSQAQAQRGLRSVLFGEKEVVPVYEVEGARERLRGPGRAVHHRQAH